EEHGAEDALGEVAVVLDLDQRAGGRGEVDEDVHAALLLVDLVGEAALVPLLHGDDLAARGLDRLADVRDRVAERGGDLLADEVHALVRTLDFHRTPTFPRVVARRMKNCLMIRAACRAMCCRQRAFSPALPLNLFIAATAPCFAQHSAASAAFSSAGASAASSSAVNFPSTQSRCATNWGGGSMPMRHLA